jgi:hypothetical protein
MFGDPPYKNVLNKSALTGRLTSLSERFTAPPRFYIEAEGGVREPDAPGRGQAWWVVSRARCKFHKVNYLTDASDARQAGALALQVERLTPFAETGVHIHYGPRFASVWLWDKAAVDSAAEAAGLDARRLRVVPETALTAPGFDDLRLVETSDGYEGQSWMDGALSASRWWPDLPASRDWLLFQRGASLPADRLQADVPEPEMPVWLDRPWTRSRRSSSLDFKRIDLRMAALGFGAVAFVVFAYLTAEIVRIALDTHSVNAQIAENSRSIQPILDARSAARGNIAALKLFQDMDRYPGQLEVMALIAAQLPRNETHFTEWTWDNGQLETTIAADHPLDTLFFVRALERIPEFKAVNAERIAGDNTLRIRLTVDPKW